MESAAIEHVGMPGMRGPSPFLRLQSDEKLVELTRRGNQSAYEVLVARYDSRLIAFTRHMLGSREDAEDVVQETFAAAFNAMVADTRPINVKPWLYRIARNRSLNHLRRNTAVGVDTFDHHVAEHGLTTADKVHRKEEFRQLMADVQDLPETQKTALLLREIDALSYDQIAEAMDTTVPSVKSLLVRARVGLAEAAEARRLTCEEVREELGEVAEGLKRLSPPVRRHLRDCERCSAFRKSLKDTNKALALMLPIGPLLLLKKLVLAQVGTTASAGSSAAAGGAAATAAASTAAGTAAAGATGGAISAGVSAVASKAAATVAAAAIVTAGAVEVDQATTRTPLRTPAAAVVAQAPAAPVVEPKPAAPAAPAEEPAAPAAAAEVADTPVVDVPSAPETAPAPLPAPAEPLPAEPPVTKPVEPPVTKPGGEGPQQQIDTVTLPPAPVEPEVPTTPGTTPEVVPPAPADPETPTTTTGGQPIEEIAPPPVVEPAPQPQL